MTICVSSGDISHADRHWEGQHGRLDCILQCSENLPRVFWWWPTVQRVLSESSGWLRMLTSTLLTQVPYVMDPRPYRQEASKSVNSYGESLQPYRKISCSLLWAEGSDEWSHFVYPSEIPRPLISVGWGCWNRAFLFTCNFGVIEIPLQEDCSDSWPSHWAKSMAKKGFCLACEYLKIDYSYPKQPSMFNQSFAI